MRAAAAASRWPTRRSPLFKGRLITCDTRQARWKTHEFFRLDPCLDCGNWRHRPRPVVLKRHERLRSDESGSRSVRLRETFARLQHHVDPLTGILHDLRPFYSDKSGLLHVYVARHAYPPGTAILSAPPEDLFWRSWGKGTTPLQAKTSALCEALERYSGIFRGSEPRKRGSYRALRDRAIHPNALLNFSELQYRRRHTWNRREARHNWVPQPFDADRSVDWSPAWSLTEKTFKYVPTAYCYYGYPISKQHDFCRPDSNGNAAGSNLEEAILQGFLELIERDCVAIWWYNRLPRPAIDLDSFGQPYFRKLVRHYRRRGRRLWVLDLTHDFGIPAVAALSRRRGPRPDYLFGFGAHLDAGVAILRALTEMNQFLSSVVRDPTRRPYSGATLDEAFLRPDETARPRSRSDFPRLAGGDLRDDLNTCVRLAQERGLETLVLDQTRPGTSVAVAKVLVPGLRQFWARFAPGRLYDVPVRMGWRQQAPREAELNPVHLYM
jgi:ribosomal protein S12 methylthiotransferase accessory factor